MQTIRHTTLRQHLIGHLAHFETAVLLLCMATLADFRPEILFLLHLLEAPVFACGRPRALLH